MKRTVLFAGLLCLAAVPAPGGAYPTTGHAKSDFFLEFTYPDGMDAGRAQRWAERASETAWQDFCGKAKACGEAQRFQISVGLTAAPNKTINCFLSIDTRYAVSGWMRPRYYVCSEDGRVTPDDGEIHVDDQRQP